MAPMVVERWEKGGVGPYTVPWSQRKYDSCDLDMTRIPCPENDGIERYWEFDYLCACLPTNVAWTLRDCRVLTKSGLRRMRYTVLPQDVKVGGHQVIFNSKKWLWRERMESYYGF